LLLAPARDVRTFVPEMAAERANARLVTGELDWGWDQMI
jgi:hypothetical protein